MLGMMMLPADFRAEVQSLLRKRDKQAWNPVTLLGCSIVPAALFAHIAFCLGFQLRFHWPWLAYAIGPLPGLVICIAFTKSALSKLKEETPCRGTITFAVSLWAALISASICGDSIFRWHMFSYYSYQDLASYINIDPNQDKGQSYMDAGQVYFKESAYVMTSKAIAFENAGIYCVAPIVRWPPQDDDGSDRLRLRRAGCPTQCSAPSCGTGSGHENGRDLTVLDGGAGLKVCTARCSQYTNGARVCGSGAAYEGEGSIDCSACSQAVAAPQDDYHLQLPASGTMDFWAVGKDCCESSGANFKCGAVENGKARAGMRMLRDDIRPFYLMAVQEWSAWIGEPARHPLFFHWVEDPLAEVDRYYENAVETYGMVLLCFVFGNTLAAFGLLWLLLAGGFP